MRLLQGRVVGEEWAQAREGEEAHSSPPHTVAVSARACCSLPHFYSFSTLPQARYSPTPSAGPGPVLPSSHCCHISPGLLLPCPTTVSPLLPSLPCAGSGPAPPLPPCHSGSGTAHSFLLQQQGEGKSACRPAPLFPAIVAGLSPFPLHARYRATHPLLLGFQAHPHCIRPQPYFSSSATPPATPSPPHCTASKPIFPTF